MNEAFEHGGSWRADSTVFATAVISLCLLTVGDADAQFVAQRAACFLRTQMRPPGLWRFWTAEHAQHGVIPLDCDDTACALAVLSHYGGASDTVRQLLVTNRDRSGLFYTWFVPHRGSLPRSLGAWRAASSGWRRPVHRYGFWRITAAEPDDVDSVVNANVLFALGEIDETRHVVEHLIKVVREERESVCDKWYHRSLAVHQSIARCFAAGVGGLDPIRELAMTRILAHQRTDGSFGDGPLDTALALCALRDWGFEGPEVRAARASLVGSQLPNGGWPPDAYFIGGPARPGSTRWGWGSEELTAGFCLRALSAAVVT